jgi:hypothetical protein
VQRTKSVNHRATDRFLLVRLRHVADRRILRRCISPVDLMDSLKVEKRPAAPSVRRGLEGYAKYRARNTRKD